MTTQTAPEAPAVPEAPTEERGLDVVVHLFGEVIAENRWRRWDELAASRCTWDEYRAANPVMAAIYREDGRSDAECLIGYVQGALQQTRVNELRHAATVVPDPDSAALLAARADALDLNPNRKETD